MDGVALLSAAFGAVLNILPAIAKPITTEDGIVEVETEIKLVQEERGRRTAGGRGQKKVHINNPPHPHPTKTAQGRKRINKGERRRGKNRRNKVGRGKENIEKERAKRRGEKGRRREGRGRRQKWRRRGRRKRKGLRMRGEKRKAIGRRKVEREKVAADNTHALQEVLEQLRLENMSACIEKLICDLGNDSYKPDMKEKKVMLDFLMSAAVKPGEGLLPQNADFPDANCSQNFPMCPDGGSNFLEIIIQALISD